MIIECNICVATITGFFTATHLRIKTQSVALAEELAVADDDCFATLPHSSSIGITPRLNSHGIIAGAERASLSEDLFDDTHDPRYADFYESTLWNHILSTQDPKTGGYVYFTSLRPQSYRIYSQVNQGMWCCVGTGMENHGKYGHFIYTHSAANDTLYVNLFTASELSSSTFGIRQETLFPYEQKTTLTTPMPPARTT